MGKLDYNHKIEPRSDERIAVLVLGMHRSGTSALTRVLSLLGCDLPETLMGANETNEAGHWESDILCGLNDAILDSAGSHWHDWLAFNPGWYSSPRVEEFKERALAALEHEFGESRLFVLKDPRICRFAPFWLDVLAAANIRPAIILPLRNPLEVAASLEKRNGFDPALDQLLWLRHVLEAEAATRGMARFHCSYGGLMTGWSRLAARAQEALGIFWPRLCGSTGEEIDAFLTDRLQHHREPPKSIENPMLSVWLRNTFAIFSRWAEEGETPSDYAALDRIRAEFDAAAPAFAPLISSGFRARQEAQGLKLALEEMQGKLAGAEAALAAGEGRTQNLEGEIHHMQSRLEENVTERDQLTAERDALQQTMAAAEQQLTLSRAEAEGATARLDETQNQLSAAMAQLADKDGRIAQLAAERDDLTRAMEAARWELTETHGKLSHLESALAQRQEEIAQAYAELAGQREACAALKEILDESQARNEAAQRKLAEADAWVFRLAAERKEYETLARRAERKLLEAQGEHRQTEAAHEREKTAMAARLNEVESKVLELEDSVTAKEVLLGQALEGSRETEAQLGERFAEIAELTQLLQKRDEEVGAAEAARGIAERQLGAHFSEVATLTKILRDASSETDASKAHSQWLRRMNAVASGFPRWWGLMPTAWRCRSEHARYARAGLFNADKYLQLYPDVAASGMDPVRHYILHGMDESRRNPR